MRLNNNKFMIFKRISGFFVLFLLAFAISACKKEEEKPTPEDGNPLEGLTIAGDLTHVTENVALIPSIEYKGKSYNITWSTSNEDVISPNGRVIRPKHTESNVDVVVVAKVTNDLSKTKSFLLTVIKTSNVVEDALQQINIPYLHGLYQAIDIPFYVEYQSEPYIVTWKSSNETSLDIDGAQFKISPNPVDGDNVNVVLTAEILGDTSASRKFPVNVLGLGAGTQASPYKIYNESTFDRVRTNIDNSDIHFRLNNDISININNQYRMMDHFKGSFDGGFNSIYLSGSISGDDFKAPKCTNINFNCFSLFGVLDGARVSNLHIDSDLSFDASTGTGVEIGLVGIMTKNAPTLSHISVSGVIEYAEQGLDAMSRNIAGVVARTSTTTFILDNISSTLDINVTTNSLSDSFRKELYVGGIIGDSFSTVAMTNVSNTGTINIVDNDTKEHNGEANKYFIGGIIANTSTDNTFTNIHANADIGYELRSAKTSEIYIGGIAGNSSSMKLVNSASEGDINFIASKINPLELYVGGIFGYMSGKDDVVAINTSYSTSNVSVHIENAATSMTGLINVGGIVGRFRDGIIKNSLSTGIVSYTTSNEQLKASTTYGVNGLAGTSVSKSFVNTGQRFYPYTYDGAQVCNDTTYVSANKKTECQLFAANSLEVIRPEQLLKSSTFTSKYSFDANDWSFTNLAFLNPREPKTSKFFGPKLTMFW